MKQTEDFIRENFYRFQEELLHLLRIPSVSADPAYTPSVLACAHEVAAQRCSTGRSD